MAKAVNILKIFFLLVLIVTLILGFLIWFNVLGILRLDNFRDYVLLQKKPEIEALIANDDPLMGLRNNKDEISILAKLEEINRQKTELLVQEESLKQLDNDLKQREEAVISKEKALKEQENRYTDRQANLEQNARYLEGMQPERAVEILNDMEDLEAVDTLRMAEEKATEEGRSSLVAFWLSLMTPERAASLQSLMTQAPSDTSSS